MYILAFSSTEMCGSPFPPVKQNKGGKINTSLSHYNEIVFQNNEKPPQNYELVSQIMT